MKLQFDYFTSILIVKKGLSKEKFLQRTGGNAGSFASNTFSRMYDCIFSGTCDLEAEYEEFYKPEYDSFEEFLYRKMNLDEETIASVIEFRQESSEYSILKKKENNCCDYSLEQFIFSDTLYPRIESILLDKKIESDEN